jgi:hypothetical protein
LESIEEQCPLLHHSPPVQVENLVSPVKIPRKHLTIGFQYHILVPSHCLLQTLGQDVNKKQRRTLECIFEKPVRSDIPWSDIEALFVGLGARITEGSGSRVRISLNAVKAVFHRPHPERVSDRGEVASVRKFLENAGVRP